MLLSELTAVWQSTARPKAPRKAAWDDPRAQTPALVARTRPKSQHPTCQQQQAPPQFFPHLWKYFLNHCLSSHVLLLQNIETAWQPHALQEGKHECRHANSWPQKRSSLRKHTLKKKKRKGVFPGLGLKTSCSQITLDTQPNSICRELLSRAKVASVQAG